MLAVHVDARYVRRRTAERRSTVQSGRSGACSGSNVHSISVDVLRQRALALRAASAARPTARRRERPAAHRACATSASGRPSRHAAAWTRRTRRARAVRRRADQNAAALGRDQQHRGGHDLAALPPDLPPAPPTARQPARSVMSLARLAARRDRRSQRLRLAAPRQVEPRYEAEHASRSRARSAQRRQLGQRPNHRHVGDRPAARRVATREQDAAHAGRRAPATSCVRLSPTITASAAATCISSSAARKMLGCGFMKPCSDDDTVDRDQAVELEVRLKRRQAPVRVGDQTRAASRGRAAPSARPATSS